MSGLRSILERAQSDGVAVAHFNIADFSMLKEVFEAARELMVPVIVGASESEREFLGARQIAALVHDLQEEFGFPIFLNADHTHSLRGAIEAANAGYDSIVFDLSALPVQENIRQTREAIDALKRINPEILIEGEIGDIGTGSEIHETAPDLAKGLTTPEDAKHYVDSTGVDVLAFFMRYRITYRLLMRTSHPRLICAAIAVTPSSRYRPKRGRCTSMYPRS